MKEGATMERIISLLREKNHYLERFFTVNEHELINFGEGNFENVEAFYQAREKILELVRCIDGLIQDETERTAADAINPEDKSDVEELMKSKDEWVASILAQDLQVLAYIDKEKSNIIKELRTNSHARRAVSAYRSNETSNQLDEKA